VQEGDTDLTIININNNNNNNNNDKTAGGGSRLRPARSASTSHSHVCGGIAAMRCLFSGPAISRARPNVNYNSHVTIKIKSHPMAAPYHACVHI